MFHLLMKNNNKPSPGLGDEKFKKIKLKHDPESNLKIV